MEENGHTEMAWRVRTSKYRHVFGNPAKKEQCYECIKITKNAHDSNFCAANPKFIAVVTESAGGGSFLVIPVHKTGRVDVNAPKVCGHSGPVLDVKWNPFDDHVIASCSDDTTVKLWQIPEDGLKGNLTEWIVDLHGHQRRVGYIEWHPTAENIILSAGYDFKCILWNTERAEPVNIISCHPDTIFSIAWNRDGSMFATTCKDRKIRVIDPRDCTVISEGLGHQGSRASKVTFIGDNNRLFTTGFSKMSERQYSIWDYKNLSKPLKTEDIDTSNGVLLPYFDYDTHVMFIAGKGDGNIRYYEIVNDPPYCHYLNQYQSGSPQRGLGVMCKRGMDTSKCEIVRFFKLHTTKNLVEPISMIVPRKSEMFQEDIFPPTSSSCPSLTADEWLSGQNCDPILVSMKDHHLLPIPKSRPAKAVQHKVTSEPYHALASRPAIRKDGIVSHSPTITTYKAVKRDSSVMDTGTGLTSANKRNISKSTAFGRSASVSSTTPEKLPHSVRNIQKLSSVEETQNKCEGYPDKVILYDSKRPIAHLESTTRYTNTNSPIRVDKKMWHSAYTSASLDIPTTAEIPKTDPELISEQSVHQVAEPNIDSNLVSSGSPFRRTGSLQGSRVKHGRSIYEAKKQVSEERMQPSADVNYKRLHSVSSVTSDHFYTPPSSPTKIDREQGDNTPFTNGSPDRSRWADNPLYATDRSSKMAAHVRNNVDITPLDDVLHDVLRDFESTASDLVDPNLKKASSEYFPPSSHANSTELQSLQSSQRAKSDINIEKGSFSSKPYHFHANSMEVETDDIDKQAMLDCISVDAPDDTLIKPSKLRASMRSRKAQSSASSGVHSSPDRNMSSSSAEAPSHFVSSAVLPGGSADVMPTTKSYHNGTTGYMHLDSTGRSPPLTSHLGSEHRLGEPGHDYSEKVMPEINNNVKTRYLRRSRNEERSKSDQIIVPRDLQSNKFSSDGAQGINKFVFKMDSQAADSLQLTESDTTRLDRTHRGSFRSYLRSAHSKSEPQIDDVNSLRKAYFHQLEEIRSLKEQISLKDKRIRQLEDEVRCLRTSDPGESNC